MSGGSLEYIFRQVDDAADMVDGRATKLLHRAFAAHLRKCAKALHDLEWMLSSDSSEGSEDAAIKAVVAPADVLNQATIEAEVALANLRQALKELPK